MSYSTAVDPMRTLYGCVSWYIWDWFVAGDATAR
jgi:hypothetical protein